MDSKINYVEVPNEAAFYGPKIDVQVWSVIGREFTLATNQVDFAVPRRFGLVYRDKDNTEKTPLCIHRAPLGTHERFIGFLIEHYAGNFPLWLAPDQVRVITLNDDATLIDYAKPIVNELRANMVRVEPDFSATPIKAKIANAAESQAIVDELKASAFVLRDITVEEKFRQPPPPARQLEADAGKSVQRSVYLPLVRR